MPLDMAKLCLTALFTIFPIFAIITALLYFTDNMKSNLFIYTLIGCIAAYVIYVFKVTSDYNMTSSAVINRGVNQIDFNNNYAEKIEYCKDIDLGTRVIGRERIQSNK